MIKVFELFRGTITAVYGNYYGFMAGNVRCEGRKSYAVNLTSKIRLELSSRAFILLVYNAS